MVIQSPRTTKAKRDPRTRFLLPIALVLATALLLALLTGACTAPSYYAQAVSGQVELMRQRESIDDLLADESTNSALAARLALARDVHEFAIGPLGLPDNGGYRHYVETGREAVTWIVAATPEFSLQPETWCFLFAGCVPYRGYFDRTEAEHFAARLGARDYDTIVGPTTAYSTLGWFDDPLLDTMFIRGDAEFAGTLFHEMAHQALYVKNDTAFNESFASFVEETGVRLWLESRDDAMAYASWLGRRERVRAVDTEFARRRAELETLYASGATEQDMRKRKQEILDGLCTTLAPAQEQRSGSTPCEINNASFALRQAYHGGLCAFEALYRDAEGDMGRFIALATERSKQAAEDRAAWLSRPCDPVAPNDDL